MSPKANTRLQLIPSHPDPVQRTRTVGVNPVGSASSPSAAAMAAWRRKADAQLEQSLAEFDMAIIGGREPARSAHALCHGFMDWTRESVAAFHRRPVTDAQRAEWSRERAVWIGLADLAAQDASNDPASVDRFLQIWLGVVHEASATGRSWLFVR